MEFKELWDVESAMKVLAHDTVDGKLWAEAVEWLMLYGPPEIKQMLLDASSSATGSAFPELLPSHFTPDGHPVYDVAKLAKALGIPEAEVQKILKEKDKDGQVTTILHEDDGGSVH